MLRFAPPQAALHDISARQPVLCRHWRRHDQSVESGELNVANMSVAMFVKVIGTSTSVEELNRFLRLGFDSKRPLAFVSAANLCGAGDSPALLSRSHPKPAKSSCCCCDQSPSSQPSRSKALRQCRPIARMKVRQFHSLGGEDTSAATAALKDQRRYASV